MTHPIHPALTTVIILSLCFTCNGFSQSKAKAKGMVKPSSAEPAPTYANLPYREGHPQTVLDFWKAEADEPTPLVIYLHGGGFSGGSKKIPPQQIRKFLAAGISVAGVEYRFIQDARLPAAHHDCRRALQFLRSKSAEWNLDPERIGAWGGSAGAQLCMYLAFHDEMADPESTDPIARESTRLHCISTNGGQATMDLEWFKKWIPEYEAPHRSTEKYFGELTPEALGKTLSDLSALPLLSKDDPPLYMNYRMRPEDPVPDGPAAHGWKIHHVIFGVKLKEKMDALGLESYLNYPGKKSEKHPSFADFLIAKLRE
ncbi:alpha/beta hydrolase [Verrucomicrobiales bacterium BCK34]|nr:alpha/beta hydrolase [Verrucomicrobiales bacterium BCK34]